MLQNVMMLGGGKKIKSALRGESGVNPVSIMTILILLFLLRALIVQWTYNKVAPTLIGNWAPVYRDDNKQFKPLTFEEALLFTLLISFLFM